MIRLLIILIPLVFLAVGCTNETNRKAAAVVNAPPAEVNSLKLQGHYKELVIAVSFPDRDNSYPTIKSNDQFPLLGSFPDGRLLSDYVKSKGGSIPADEWHKPALNHYFNSHSGGMYTVDFNFLKQKDGKAYTTKSTLDSWIKKHGEANDVIWVFWNEMANEAAEKVYADNPNIFKGVQAIHMVFAGINKNEFNTQHGGTVIWDVKLKNKKGAVIYKGPLSIQRDLGSIAHERMHIIGSLHGTPKGFGGFPDRGYDVEAGEGHYNIFWGYDMMYHNASIPSQHSLYGLPPIISHDLIFLGWIKPEEIIVVNKNNYKNYDEIKLSDVNYPLTSKQIADGYRRIAKVMIRENFLGGKNEYYLIEFHNATEFDKNFANYDEYPKYGYNKGILIWHIKETKDNISVSGDNMIDLEVAVPYNGFNGDPVPDDNYPRDNYKRPKNWNGIMDEDCDYLDDGKQKDIGNNHWVFEYMPDGGRSEWEVSTKGMTWGWYPKDPSRFPRLQSMRSDFFTDEKIKGHRSDEFTDDTRPSTKTWGGYYGGKVEEPQKTGISITEIKSHGSYMTIKVSY